MMNVRKGPERGHFKNNWLESFHSFSFSDYYDPKHMNFRALRVINHDFIQPDSGFGKHPHRDMEIITYVLQGTVEHQDSMGNKEQIRAGEVQVMSAGTGVAHSEYNPSPKETLELLQIWVSPKKMQLKPSYGQHLFKPEEKLNRWKLLVSEDGREESLKISQDALIWTSILEAGKSLSYEVGLDRGVWIQVAQGELSVSGQNLKKGDAVSFEGKERIELKGVKNGEVLLFDMGPL